MKYLTETTIVAGAAGLAYFTGGISIAGALATGLITLGTTEIATAIGMAGGAVIGEAKAKADNPPTTAEKIKEQRMSTIHPEVRKRLMPKKAVLTETVRNYSLIGGGILGLAGLFGGYALSSTFLSDEAPNKDSEKQVIEQAVSNNTSALLSYAQDTNGHYVLPAQKHAMRV